MAKYDITKEASDDLYKIWEYTFDTWSETQADKYYATLESAFAEIASSSDRIGKPYDVIMPGLRAYHVKRHLVFYSIQDNGRALIIRILHEKMDYARHFHL